MDDRSALKYAMVALPTVHLAVVVRDQPGRVYPDWTLSEPEINLITSGVSQGKLNGVLREKKAGEIYAYRPGDRSEGWRNLPSAGAYTCRVIRFSLADAKNPTDSTELWVPRELRLSPQALNHVTALFDGAIEAFREGHASWQIHTAGYLLSILATMAREHAKSSIRRIPKGRSAAERRLHTALQYMEKNFASAIKIERIAQEVGLTEDYFSRQFRRLLGIGPLQHLIQLRVREARRLLTEPSTMKIPEIAARAGFSDPKHFAIVFRHHFGVTPSDFREAVLMGRLI